MRLSEAIALGSLMIESEPCTRFGHNGSGCALGMAEVAVGIKREDYDYIETHAGYAWLNEPVTYSPCGCRLDFDYATLTTCIAHTFNEHVHGKKDWTLERLIDWVRSVEPAEEETPVHGEPVQGEPVAVQDEQARVLVSAK